MVITPDDDNSPAMTDAEVDDFARQNRGRQAKVNAAGAIVLLALGIVFSVAGYAAFDGKGTGPIRAKVLGAGIGFIFGAALLAANAWRLRRIGLPTARSVGRR